MSDYPIGARWITEYGKSGYRGSITLRERNEHFEIWHWGVQHKDGSIPFGWDAGDWGTSREQVRQECIYRLGEKLRFKRVKE